MGKIVDLKIGIGELTGDKWRVLENAETNLRLPWKEGGGWNSDQLRIC
jgi:hypothetical protein